MFSSIVNSAFRKNILVSRQLCYYSSTANRLAKKRGISLRNFQAKGNAGNQAQTTAQPLKTTLSSVSSAAAILDYEALVVNRDFEYLNIFVGFEQANKYCLQTPTGEIVGYMAEDSSMGSWFVRNLLRRRRPINVTVMNSAGTPVLKINRPMYFINSRISVSDVDGNFIGETAQDWHLWRRRYDLFASNDNELDQFARVDGGFLALDFVANDGDGKPLGAVNKNFTGFGREIFTDANNYALHMDFPLENNKILTYDQRATLLATAISIDTDYFTRARGGLGFFPFPMPFWGGGAAAGEAGAAAGAAGAAGAASEVGAVGGAAASGIGGVTGGVASAGEVGAAAVGGMGGAAIGHTMGSGATGSGFGTTNDFGNDSAFTSSTTPQNEPSYGDGSEGFADEQGMDDGEGFAPEETFGDAGGEDGGSIISSIWDIVKDFTDE